MKQSHEFYYICLNDVFEGTVRGVDYLPVTVPRLISEVFRQVTQVHLFVLLWH